MTIGLFSCAGQYKENAVRTNHRHKGMSDAEFRACHQRLANTDPFSRDVINTLSRLEQAELSRRSAGRAGGKTSTERLHDTKSSPNGAD